MKTKNLLKHFPLFSFLLINMLIQIYSSNIEAKTVDPASMQKKIKSQNHNQKNQKVIKQKIRNDKIKHARRLRLRFRSADSNK